jgi:2'-5' RNA ligase
LTPHEELRKRIRSVREEFYSQYKIIPPRNASVGLCLARFYNRELMEEKIAHRMHIIAMGQTPFKVEMQNFGSFPSHSIYFKVNTRIPVQKIISQLKSHARLLKINNENKPLFMDEPYFILGSRLKPWQYEEGWLVYSQKQFSARFIADNMMLLKRSAGNKGPFQIVRRFEFQDLPVTTLQGSFF